MTRFFQAGSMLRHRLSRLRCGDAYLGAAYTHTTTRAASAATRGNALCGSDSRGVEKPPLRIGVVGLGAIGTIFFTKIGCAALENARHGRDTCPRIAVDAFVKKERFKQLFHGSSLAQVALHEQCESSERVLQRIPFAVARTNEWVAEALNGSSSACVRIRALADEDEATCEDEQLDVVLLAVKAYDSVAVVSELQRTHARLFREDALFILLQNGLGELPADLSQPCGDKRQKLPSWRFAHGVTFMGGRVMSTANVLASGVASGTTYFAPVVHTPGSWDDTDDRIDLLGRVLTAAGSLCVLCSGVGRVRLRWQRLSAAEMKAMLWKKLIVNAGINPIASILNASNQSVGACDWSRDLVRAVVHEASQVAEKENIAFNRTEEELVQDVLQVAANTGTNVCSMLADLRNGSRTEIDAITGTIVALGRTHGVPTPANKWLVQRIKALESSTERCSFPRKQV